MRALQRLTKNGPSAAVTIARPLVKRLAWCLGDRIVVERFEDHSVRVRRPTEADFTKQSTRALIDSSLWSIMRLTPNGSCVALNIPRRMLVALGWLCGQNIIVELVEDRELLIRLPVLQDFGPITSPRLLHDATAEVKS